MTNTGPLVECVPNFSEGRNSATVDHLCSAISGVPGIALLHRTSDGDHNRSVITFVGNPAAVVQASLAAAGAAVQRIDLRTHSGVHPRIGALDVLPFVPVAGITLEDCAHLAVEAGEQIWEQWELPVFLYEAAARDPQRRALEAIRSPAFGGAPDIGKGRHPTAGASVVGARKFLVAWNIWLKSPDLALAKQIARAIRQSTGGFPGVKALGLPLASEGVVQVSINSTDWEATSLPVIFSAVEQLARDRGVELVGSELIGLIPRKAVQGTEHLGWLNMHADSVLENRLEAHYNKGKCW